MLNVSVRVFFLLGPSVSQLNGSAVHSNVSYPGNLTHRGNLYAKKAFFFIIIICTVSQDEKMPLVGHEKS